MPGSCARTVEPVRWLARSHTRRLAREKFGGGCNRACVRHPYVPDDLDRTRRRRRAAPRPASSSGGWTAGAGDPAEQVALVARSKRELLLGANRFRSRREDLEDCFSQATLELVAYVRAGGTFRDALAVGRALEVRFASRIRDRQRAVGGRSPMVAALETAMRVGQPGEDAIPIVDPRVDVERLVLLRDELRRVQRLARALTADQQLVLREQLQCGEQRCQDFCRRAGWSAEKYRKVAQRARARLRALMLEDERGVPRTAVRSDQSAGTNL